MADTKMGKYMVMVKEVQCAKLKETFALFDKEKTGFIKCEDVGKVVGSIGLILTDDQVKGLIGVLDVNKNGVVEFSMFMNFMAAVILKDGEPEEELKTAFKFLDKDEDGFISAEELSHSLASIGKALMTEEQANSIAKAADLDGDGEVSYEDFKKFMLRICDSI